MAQQRLHRNTLNVGVLADVIGANSVQTSMADPVNISATGFMDIAATGGAKIHGYANDARTHASDNQTVAKAKTAYFPWMGMQVVYGFSAAPVASDRGTYVDIGTSSTGAFVLTQNTSDNSITSTNTLQFHVVDIDPTGQSVAEVVVEAATPQAIATGAV